MTRSAYARFTARLFAQNQFSIKLGLARMRRALGVLGDPLAGVPKILVAGTNGKGTTAAFLSTLLGARGLRVGLYTSPHLLDVRERFRVAGKPVSREEVLEVGLPILATFAGIGAAELSTEGSDAAVELGWSWPQAPGSALTFFELTTLMAAELFSRRGVEVAVLEVGLGGRLDAVNALDPDITVITSIGLDHQQYLGDTIEAIAREKAATMRAGRTTVVARQPFEEAERALVEHAEAIGAALTPAPEIECDLPARLGGDFRWNVWSAAAAASAFVRLPGFGGHREPSPEEISRLANTFRWPGRRDRIRIEEPSPYAGRFLLDAAHNPQGAASLAAYLVSLPAPPRVGIMGMMDDKDVEGAASVLAPLCPRWVATCAESGRSAAVERVADALRLGGADDVTRADDVHRALRTAAAYAPNETLVTGSIYLLGDVARELGVTADSLGLTCLPDGRE